MKIGPLTTTPAKQPDASRRMLEQLRDVWRHARDEAAAAYGAWCSAPVAQRRSAYAVYLAAADRETAAELALVQATRAA